jgi:hypothetical protein
MSGNHRRLVRVRGLHDLVNEVVGRPITPVENNGDSQVASTPAPTDDNNGLHLGQTKQPTKKPNNHDNSNDKDKDKKK